MSKTESLIRVGIAYVVAFGVGIVWLVAGPDTDWLWLDALIADLLATVVVFAASRMHGNSSFYDAYWSVLPPLLAVYWWVAADGAGDPARYILLSVVMWLWAIRLTANWIHGFPGLHHEDWRYPLLRDRAGRWELVTDLFAIHVIPTLQVFLAMLPVYVVATRGDRALGWLDIMALLVGLGAVLLEAVSDLQMHSFVRRAQQGDVMKHGLWSWSRHPNYFGEFSFWVSLALFGVAADAGAWWAWAGVVGMLAMFQGASIPMMEQRSLERRPEYQTVIDTVPRFVPLPAALRRTAPSAAP